MIAGNISLFSQITKHHFIVKNDISINTITRSNTKNTVLFFCPTAYIDTVVYKKKATELSNNLKLKGISDLTLHFIYFKQDTKNNSKGVRYISQNEKDTIFIGQFECFFIGFDNSNLLRAKNKMKFNYDIEHSFINENIYKVPIVDTNKCFKNMPDRIPFYADFIKESIQPSYSTDERIQFLQDSVNLLSKQVKIVIKPNEELIKKTQELINQLNSANSQNKPPKGKPSDNKTEAVDPKKSNQ